MKRRRFGFNPTIMWLATTHFLVDSYGNIYAPLLPLLIPRLGMSLATAGLLQTCFQMASSVAQLGFGHVADRWRPRLLVVAGPVCAVSVLPLIGLATNEWMLAAVLMVGGLGTAAFHPTAAGLVHRLADARHKASAMAFHITLGSLGFALGPVLFAPFAGRFGLTWTPVLMIPGLALLALVLRKIPAVGHLHESQVKRGFAALRPYAKPLTLLYAIVVLRTLASLSYATFMSVMLTRRGTSVGMAGAAVAIYLFSTGVGGFVGGSLADRFGARRMIIWTLVAAVPFLAVAPSFDGWAFIAIVSLGGFLLQSTLPVNVTFGQTLAPISAATVSSLMMGFGWGTAGISVPFVGMLADRIGIERALTTMSLMPLLAAALALPLPATAGPVRPARASEIAGAEPE